MLRDITVNNLILVSSDNIIRIIILVFLNRFAHIRDRKKSCFAKGEMV